jgi:hypothetical protein
MLIKDITKQTKAVIIKVILVKVLTISKNLILFAIYKDVSPISLYFKSF